MPKHGITKEAMVDIVIVVWNQRELTAQCLNSVEKNTDTSYHMIIVDNGSEEETAAFLKDYSENNKSRVTLIRNAENLGFILGANLGVREGRSPYLCFLNNDTIVTRGWLSSMLHTLRGNPHIGMVNPLGNEGDRLKYVQDLEGWAEKLSGNAGQYIETGYCSGFCLLISRELFFEAGEFSEDYGRGNWEDRELACKLGSKDKVPAKCLDSLVFHHWHKSFEAIPDWREESRKNRAIFEGRWGKPLRIIYPLPERFPSMKARFIQVAHSVRAFAKYGSRVEILCGKGEAEPEDTLPFYGLAPHEEVKVKLLPMIRPRGGAVLRFSWNLPFFISCLFDIAQKTKKRHYDAVYIRHIKLADFLIKYKAYVKAPIIYEMHEPFHLTTGKRERAGKLKEMENRVFAGADWIICNTSSNKEIVQKLMSTNTSISVVPNGVEASGYLKYDIPHPVPKLLYVGSFQPWKGLNNVFSSLKLLSDWDLLVVGGKGKELDDARKKALELGVVDRVTFAGWMTIEQVQEKLSEGGVALVPLSGLHPESAFSSPIKIFEYMAAGLPVIASDFPGVRDVITDGENGIIVKPDSPEEVQEQALKLFLDQELWLSIASAARESSKKYTWNRRAESVRKIISDVSSSS